MGNYIHDFMDTTQTPKATGLIGIQDEYVETVNAGIARWSHARKS